MGLAAEANKAAGSQRDIMRWPIAILLLCGVFAAYATSVENPTAEGVKKDVAVEDNATLKLVESKPEEKVADAPVEPVKADEKEEEVEVEKEEEEKDIQTEEEIPKEVEGHVVDDEESEQSDPRTLVRHTFKASICENHKVNLKCRNGLIQIVSANYGRTSRGVCRKTFSMWNSNCRSHRSDFQVKKQCNKKRNCKLFASNSVFGDPCRGTYKYLEVRFRCVRPVRKVVVHKKIVVHTVRKGCKAIYAKNRSFNCWNSCHKRGGRCNACGEGGYCCRKWQKDCPNALSSKGNMFSHTCVVCKN